MFQPMRVPWVTAVKFAVEDVASASGVAVHKVARVDHFAGRGDRNIRPFPSRGRRIEQFANHAPGLPGGGALGESEDEAAQRLIAEEHAARGDGERVRARRGGSTSDVLQSDACHAHDEPASGSNGGEPGEPAIH